MQTSQSKGCALARYGQRLMGVARGSSAIGAIVIVALVVTSCGSNERGEPRSLARKLGAPTLGDASVYCVRDQDPEVCDVELEVRDDPSLDRSVAWWLRASADARATGVFRYEGRDWRWGDVTLTRDGFVGWKCPGDDSFSPRQAYLRMLARTPSRPSGIKSLGAARQHGCHAAVRRNIVDP